LNSPTQELLNGDFIAKAVWECLKNNDPEGVMEVIEIHLEIVNKVKAAKEKDLSRSTMYNAFKGKNPTVKTLAKLVNCCV
jgi:DNA-binding phage protein